MQRELPGSEADSEKLKVYHFCVCPNAGHEKSLTENLNEGKGVEGLVEYGIEK